MKIEQENNHTSGRFYIEENGQHLALLSYTWRDDKTLIIDHTEVDESLQGKGTGMDLVKAAVEYAREQSVKIIPQCSYAQHVFNKEKSFSDVLE